MPKAERLLNLLVMLLETPRPVSLQEIHRTIPGYGQDEWSSFKRMFERDKDDLREMGIPLELAPVDVWGAEQGYRVPKDRYYLPPLALQPDELAALWLAAGLMRVNDPEIFRSASLKLEYDAAGAVPSELPGMSADLGLAGPNLARAFEAAAGHKRVLFRYRSSSGVRDRTVDPYHLIQRRGAWYITGLDHHSGEVRSFRLDRVEGALQLQEPGRPEPDFEPPDRAAGAGALDLPPFVQGAPVLTATVRFDASTAWLAERTAPWLGLDFDSGGSAVASIGVSDPGGFVSWVLGFGESAEVTGPQELRTMIAARLKEMCERY